MTAKHYRASFIDGRLSSDSQLGKKLNMIVVAPERYYWYATDKLLFCKVLFLDTGLGEPLSYAWIHFT